MSGRNILVDTNIILYLVNGDETIAEVLNDRNIYVSFVTELELLGYEGLVTEEKEIFEALIKEAIVIDINGAIKQKVIELRKQYRLKLPDAIIAATALYLDTPFISADEAFEKVEKLSFLRYDVED